MGRRSWVPIAVLLTALLASGCSSATSGRGTPGPSNSPAATTAPSSARPTPPRPTTSARTTTRTAPSTPSRPTTAPSANSRALRILAGMSPAERVGQLFMIDCPSTGAGPATLSAIGTYHVGSVILDGTSQLGIQQTRAVTDQLQQHVPHVGLFVATDQEGGQVQRLRGPGFSVIPSALEQGRQSPAGLRADARQWGSQLREAGVNVDLGPVLDTVPASFGPNPPIGDLDREYGHDPATVSSHGNAVALGLRDAGVDAAVKHFPGLGRVSGNTDTTSGVRDTVTTRHDPYLTPFAAAVHNDVAFVMISTAIYTRIDPDHPATFSPTIVTDMLHGDLGFRGVIISDDIGVAQQVSGYSVGDRAVTFIAAGGDVVLSVDATQAPEMTAAVLARAKTDPKFRKQVDAAALVVLTAKETRGLLR